jgi:hypothetical protein
MEDRGEGGGVCGRRWRGSGEREDLGIRTVNVIIGTASKARQTGTKSLVSQPHRSWRHLV